MSMTRRTVLGAVGAGSAATVGRFSLPTVRAVSASDPNEWPQFKRDARNTGYDPNATLPASVETKWRYRVDQPIQSAPAVAHGRCFVGATDGQCHAVDVRTGDPLWRADVGGEVRSSPAVTGEMVCIGGKRNNVAFDAETGEEQWSRRTTASAVHTAPTIAGRSVYISKGDEAKAIEAIFHRSGELRVTFETPLGPTTPVVSDGSVIAGFEDGTIRNWDTRITNEQWFTGTDSPVEVDPVVTTLGNDRRATVIYTDQAGVLRAVNASNGRLRWRYDLGKTSGSPAVSEHRVVAGTGDFTLQAFNTKGIPVWSRELDGRVVASPVMSAESVVVGAGSTLYALDATSGETRWATDLDGRVTRAAAIAGGFVVVGTDGGSLYALGASDDDFGDRAATATPTESPTPTHTATATQTATSTETQAPTGTATPSATQTARTTPSSPTPEAAGGSTVETILRRLESLIDGLVG
jgi:outer membrane protein assembly factor BamB